MKRIEQSELGQLPHLDSLSPEMRSIVKGTAVWILAEYISKYTDPPISVETAIKCAVTIAMKELKDEGSL